MTRLMGDAIHDQVPQLAAARTDLVAGYVTGGPGIIWTAADWALFPSVPRVTIDQGFTGSPVADADVRDVEAGAWTIRNAILTHPWTPPRPTIYCSQSVLAQLALAGWRGDVWVALYDNIPSINFWVPPGMNCVAKQYTDTGGGGAYDLSAVFDPAWPAKQEDDPMFSIPGLPAGNAFVTPPATFVDTTTGTPIVVGQGTDGAIYMTKYVGGAWTPFVVL